MIKNVIITGKSDRDKAETISSSKAIGAIEAGREINSLGAGAIPKTHAIMEVVAIARINAPLIL